VSLNHRVPAVVFIALMAMTGCFTARPDAVTVSTLHAQGLSAADLALLEALGLMTRAGHNLSAGAYANQAQDLTAKPATASRYRTQSTPVVVVTAVDGFYAGPFPSAHSLPSNYVRRPAVGWLTANPLISTSGSSVTTETWYTPDGDTTSVPAYSKVLTRNGATANYVYAAPEQVTALPSFFTSKATFPPDPQVKIAEETYIVDTDFGSGGSALGYRWAVRDAGGSLKAWVRAKQVTRADASVVDFYTIHSDYRYTSGGMRPERFTYGTYYPATGIAQSSDEQHDAATGRFISQGVWRDLRLGKQVAIADTVEADGSVVRIMTSGTLVTTENYRPDGSGFGTLTQDGVPRATMTWPSDRNGTIVLSSGSAPYRANRGIMTPAPASTPTPTPTIAPTAAPTANPQPTTAPTTLPGPTAMGTASITTTFK